MKMPRIRHMSGMVKGRGKIMQTKPILLRLVIGITVLIIVAAAGFLLFSAAGRAGKVSVSLNIMPSDASLTLDGNPVKMGETYLRPGIYQLRANRAGFEDYSETLSLEKDKKTVSIIMTPVSDEAKRWMKDNQSEFNRMESLTEKSVIENGKAFVSRNPIVRKLPYKNFLYSVGYRLDQSDPSGNSIIIEIDAPEGYRQAALYRIRQLGYDPTDFTINFRGYENPFPL